MFIDWTGNWMFLFQVGRRIDSWNTKINKIRIPENSKRLTHWGLGDVIILTTACYGLNSWVLVKLHSCERHKGPLVINQHWFSNGCCQAISHCLRQCWSRSMSPYAVIRPQWVNYISMEISRLLSSTIQSAVRYFRSFWITISVHGLTLRKPC